jgi:hypothetical protein
LVTASRWLPVLQRPIPLTSATADGPKNTSVIHVPLYRKSFGQPRLNGTAGYRSIFLWRRYAYSGRPSPI